MIHSNNRLKALEELLIMDSLPEEEYDNITLLAAQICKTPISYISFLDDKKQWYKSKHGMDISETKLEDALCLNMVNHPKDIIVVPDLRLDDTYNSNRFVNGEPYVVFYAGVPLKSESGEVLGTLCVLDMDVNQLNEQQIESMKILGKQVSTLLELRKLHAEFKKQINVLDSLKDETKKKVKVVYNNLNGLNQILNEGKDALIDKKGVAQEYVNEAFTSLNNLVKYL